jgi:2Fe-2S type ferredoxin
VTQLFESDYASDDAPVRNAHYADVFETTDRAMAVRVHASAEGLDVTFMVEPGEYVLDGAERAGHELPFSCRSGGCLSCSAMLESGDCDMEEQYVLEDDHIEQGYRLLCLTTVTSPCTFETHVQDDIE